MAITMMQGDSYPIFLNLKQDGTALTPELVEDLEVCVGEELRYTYTGDTVKFDSSRQMWYFWPSQEETMNLEGSMEVYVRVKYPSSPEELLGFKIGNINFKNTNVTEVL